MALDPGRLRLLAALSDHGTVRAVAAELMMSPSAVSQQLGVLEHEARTVLLERHGRRLRLTPAGQRLVGHARDILDRIEAAEADLRMLSTEPVGPVRIAAFASALSSLVIPAVGRLAGEHPGIGPVLSELEPQDSFPALRRGEIDIAVVADFVDGATPLDDGVRLVPLTSDPLTVVQAADRPPTGSLADLADLPFVLDSASSYLAHLVLRLCRQAGFEPRVAAHFDSYHLLLQQVEAGHAVTVLPGLAVDTRRYRLQASPVQPGLHRQVAAAVRAGAPSRRAVEVVLKVLAAPDREPGRSEPVA